jgi:hypothetical protein
MKSIFIFVLIAAVYINTSGARVARGGNVGHVNVQNRSNQNLNRNVNANTNVNRNVNVNSNVNVNRNVNVHGNYYGGYHGAVVVDDGWNWGSFAAGAAVGVATTAAVAAATRPTTAVVAAPTLGTVVTALPGECASVASGGAVIYNCSSIYYQPFYQGTTLVYKVVTYP